MRLKELHFRSMRPYFLVSSVHQECENGSDESSKYHISGYVRGKPLNVNQLVHLTGVGTYRMHSIKYAEDPAPFVGKDEKVISVHGQNMPHRTRTSLYTLQIHRARAIGSICRGSFGWKTDHIF